MSPDGGVHRRIASPKRKVGYRNQPSANRSRKRPAVEHALVEPNNAALELFAVEIRLTNDCPLVPRRSAREESRIRDDVPASLIVLEERASRSGCPSRARARRRPRSPQRAPGRPSPRAGPAAGLQCVSAPRCPSPEQAAHPTEVREDEASTRHSQQVLLDLLEVAPLDFFNRISADNEKANVRVCRNDPCCCFRERLVVFGCRLARSCRRSAWAMLNSRRTSRPLAHDRGRHLEVTRRCRHRRRPAAPGTG